jgi:hypothetical protein
MATVSGEVTVDAAAVEKGYISYAPADGAGAPATAEINAGRYDLRTTAGPKRVRISVPVITGKRKTHVGSDAPWVEITAESLPDKYHCKSELEYNVQPGSNAKDWDLVVKKR